MRIISAIAIMCLWGMLSGCAPGNSPTPAASTLEPMGQQPVAQLQRTYQTARPGSQVGAVNAVIPERRVLSVGGIPSERVHRGDVMTILGPGQSGAGISAVVYDTASGYIQLTYMPLPPGQAPPRVGDIAIWYPGTAAVPPEAIQPPAPPLMTPSPGPAATVPTRREPTMSPASMPAETNPPPASMPASTAVPNPNEVIPATQPASPTTRPAADFNK